MTRATDLPAFSKALSRLRAFLSMFDAAIFPPTGQLRLSLRAPKRANGHGMHMQTELRGESSRAGFPPQESAEIMCHGLTVAVTKRIYGFVTVLQLSPLNARDRKVGVEKVLDGATSGRWASGRSRAYRISAASSRQPCH